MKRIFSIFQDTYDEKLENLKTISVTDFFNVFQDKCQVFQVFQDTYHKYIFNVVVVAFSLDILRLPHVLCFYDTYPYQQNFLERSLGWQTTTSNLGFG